MTLHHRQRDGRRPRASLKSRLALALDRIGTLTADLRAARATIKDLRDAQRGAI
jgi:hypothetical protein